MDGVREFLLAAKHAQMRLLEQLSLSCELVATVSALVHALQRERGASNMFLASKGERFVTELGGFRADVAPCETALRAALARLDTDAARSAGSVRLFSRIAFVLHALDSLPTLRKRVDEYALSPDELAASLGRLVSGLLAVVFETADAAADPEVSRALVALFNFMQGKELAGQERAAGVAGFALGGFDDARKQRLEHLIESQDRCFEIFVEFVDADMVLRWQQLLDPRDEAPFKRLRAAARSGATDSTTSELWFSLATMRIDAMRGIEVVLTQRLAGLCARRIADAEADLKCHRNMLDALGGLDTPDGSSAALLPATPPPLRAADTVLDGGDLPTGLGRSILDLVLAQAQRIQQMGDELNAARTALEERKLIERGKGLLMARRALTEEQAYRLMRQTAMDQGRKLVDVAQTVLALGPLLGEPVAPDRMRSSR